MALLRTTQGASSGSNTCPGYRYDVFLSFRGKDTRNKFTDHLYTALKNAGYRTFRDDDELKTGEGIKSGLKQAIQMSQTSVIVFSENYALSRWCLNELVEIVDHKRTSLDHVVVPVFYDVDPSHVRKQTGSFAEAFARHQETEPPDRMERWKEALEEVANLTGKVLQNQANRYESNFIKDIVEVINDKLSRTPLSVESKLIGIHSRVEDINLWLQDPSHEVGILVVYGMRGIGKTTIAKCVYNSNFKSFEGSSYVENIRETANQHKGLVQIQKQILYDILKGKKEKIHNVSEGICKIERAISNKRVLLVLDDVDHIDQLDPILRMKDRFNPGSKIIITTRDKRLLMAHDGILNLHEVVPLNFNESLELLSWHAFRQNHPPEGYEEYSKKVVQHSRGLPRTLKDFGSYLSGNPKRVWKSKLEVLEVIPDGEIMNKLRISYHPLQGDHDQKLFLHLSRFFIDLPMTTKVSNKSKGLKWIYGPCFYTVPGEGEGMAWLSRWKMENRTLEGRNQVEVYVVVKVVPGVDGFRLKEFVVEFVQEQQESNKIIINTIADPFYPYAIGGNLSLWEQIPGIYSEARDLCTSRPGLKNHIRDSDEGTDIKEEQQDDQKIVATTPGGSNNCGVRGWKLLIIIMFAVLLLLFIWSLFSLAATESREKFMEFTVPT